MCDTYGGTDIVDAGSVVYRTFGSQDIVAGAVLHKSLHLGCHFLGRSLVDDTLSFQTAQDDTVELTGGESLESNIRLVLNNAAVAARTAACLAEKA